jgi:hypothetical protein
MVISNHRTHHIHDTGHGRHHVDDMDPEFIGSHGSFILLHYFYSVLKNLVLWARSKFFGYASK